MNNSFSHGCIFLEVWSYIYCQSPGSPFFGYRTIWSIAGGIGLYVNTQRIDTHRLQYESNHHAFVDQEHKRVDGFFCIYRYFLIGWSVMILAGLVIFMVRGGHYGRATGIGLILFGTSGLLVDLTSEHNAHVYDEKISKDLQSIER